LEQRGCVPPSTWVQVLDVTVHGDVRRAGARQKICHRPTRMLVHKRSQKRVADPEVRPFQLIGQRASQGFAHFERSKHWRYAQLGVQPKIRSCGCGCKQPAQRGLSHYDLRWRLRRGRGSAEGVGARSGEGLHSSYDGNP